MTSRACTVAVVSRHPIVGLAGQTRPPDEVLTGSDGLSRAISSNADWLWMLGTGAVPRVEALERLLDATALAEEEAVSLLAGAVVNQCGELCADQLPSANQQYPDLPSLVVRHVLPIHNLRFANCLIATDCFVRHGVPDERRFGQYSDVEWSARVLRDEIGYFVPSSVVSFDTHTISHLRGASIPALFRTFRSGAWTRGEALHELGRSLAILQRG